MPTAIAHEMLGWWGTLQVHHPITVPALLTAGPDILPADVEVEGVPHGLALANPYPFKGARPGSQSPSSRGWFAAPRWKGS